MPHRIYQFSQKSREGEFLVISKEPPAEVIAEYRTNGVDLDHVYMIEGNGTGLPCDRALTHSLY